MTIGTDIKNAFSSVGTAFTIKRDSGNFSGEYLTYDIPVGSKTSFDREVKLDASFAYDTLAIEGDVLELSNGKRVLIASKTPDMFQNETVIFEASLFKCNVTAGVLYRSSGEVWDDQSYHKVQTWETIKTGINGVLVEVSGNQLSDQDEQGLLTVKKLELLVPSGEDFRVNDRFFTRSGEYFQVSVVKQYEYPAIKTIELGEDNR